MVFEGKIVKIGDNPGTTSMITAASLDRPSFLNTCTLILDVVLTEAKLSTNRVIYPSDEIFTNVIPHPLPLSGVIIEHDQVNCKPASAPVNPVKSSS